MRSRRVVAVGLATAFALVGCASPGGSVPSTQAPSAAPTDSVSVEQVRETGLTRPATVFDGRCDALFTDAELATVMGEALAIHDNHFVELWGTGGVIDQSGGLMCNWLGDHSTVIAIVLPEAAIQYDQEEGECSAEGTHDSFLTACFIEEISQGTRLSAFVSADTDAATATSQREALRAIFLDRVAALAPVPVPIPAVGAWQLPPDCESVVAAADFSAVPGLGSGSTGGNYGGYGKDAPYAEHIIAGDWSPPTCFIQGSDALVEFAPIGGSRWKEEAIGARADATVLPLDGVEAAYAVPYYDGLTLVYAFDGPNMLMLAVRHTKNAAGIATALFDALDATAVS